MQRDELDENGTMPVIPNRCNRKQTFSFRKRPYRLRWRIEATFNSATRYDRLGRNYLASVCLAACRIGSTIGQRPRKRHENNQSDNGDNDHHDDHFWVAEALTRDHERGGNVALASTERHDPFCVGVRPAEQPTSPKAQCDKQKPCKDSSGAEHLQNLVDVRCGDQTIPVG